MNEQYYMYQLAYKLVAEDNYDVLHFNVKANEIWLEKQTRKVSKVIRLVQRGFNWKNHLKADIASVFQRVRAMNKYFVGKDIEIMNVYVTDDEPVDSWETLKKTLLMKEKKPVKMNVFYITKDNLLTEEGRLLHQIDVSNNVTKSLPSPLQGGAIQHYKQELAQRLRDKNARLQQVFNFGKPRLIWVLIVINVIMFIMLELNGGSTNIETLITNGAKYNPAIVDGEWWRIVSSMFLHIGALHLLMNMIAVYYLGTAVEKIYGSIRFIIIYFIAGTIGGLTSFAFNIHVAAGASGALFGLFGALLYFGVIYQNLFFQTMGKSLLVVLLINLVFGFLVPQIDMGAHLGGLIGGFIGAALTSLPLKSASTWWHQLLATTSLVLLTIFLVWYGIDSNIT